MKQLLVTIDSGRGIIAENPDQEYHTKKSKLAGLVTLEDVSNDLSTVEVLYITQLEGFFDSEQELPSFERDFALRKQTAIKRKNGVRYQHQTWTRKNTLELRNDFVYNK